MKGQYFKVWDPEILIRGSEFPARFLVRLKIAIAEASSAIATSKALRIHRVRQSKDTWRSLTKGCISWVKFTPNQVG
jgi:hypothetical protein